MVFVQINLLILTYKIIKTKITMKKLILLCIVFVFSNMTFAQDAKEKTSKAKSKTEKAVAAKKEKADKLKECEIWKSQKS